MVYLIVIILALAAGIWRVVDGLQAEFHYQIASRRIGTPVAYLTEFFAGVARIGALPLIIML